MYINMVSADDATCASSLAKPYLAFLVEYTIIVIAHYYFIITHAN